MRERITTSNKGLKDNKSTIPGQQRGVLVLDREDGFAEQPDQLTVITLDRMEGQSGWEIWELKQCCRFRRIPRR